MRKLPRINRTVALLWVTETTALVPDDTPDDSYVNNHVLVQWPNGRIDKLFQVNPKQKYFENVGKTKSRRKIVLGQTKH